MISIGCVPVQCTKEYFKKKYLPELSFAEEVIKVSIKQEKSESPLKEQVIYIEFDSGEVELDEAVEELDDSLITIINKRFQISNSMLCAIVSTTSEKLPKNLQKEY